MAKVLDSNDVKQYNLSTGRSLPEWLDEKKKRRALKKDVDINRRIELIQDFSMPAVSNAIRISKDGNYIMASGTYKPRIKCYDVHDLGLKFERCVDSEIVTFRLLSEDYSKMVLLRCNRYIEFHAQHGRYYELRIPRFGRDFEYQPSTCELLFVGSGPEIIRLNLEQGRFLNPMMTNVSTNLGINKCAINPQHESMVVVGTADGRIEAWDTRSKKRAAALDCAFSLSMSNENGLGGLDSISNIPQVTSLAFRDGLNLGVGMSTGHILLYDIRSSKPLFIKDHYNGDPIKKLIFHSTMDQVLSLDARVVKIWDRQTGKPYTSIEAPSGDVPLNDIAIYPGSGLLFFANDQPKMQVHYVPSLGPAPRWAHFLDNITEEIEEEKNGVSVYDDYKFVTRQDLDDLGLDHLIGSNLLRAYMHGYFMDARLYTKVHSLARPYTLDRFIKDKVNEKLEEKRTKRVQIKSTLPNVNKDLFLKLKDQETGDVPKKKKSRKSDATNLLNDDRFKDMFSDERFEVDTTDEAYKLLNPVISKLDENKKKRLEKQFQEVSIDNKDDPNDNSSDDGKMSSDISESEESSDDERETREMAQKVREQHKQLRIEKAVAKREQKEKKLADKLSAVSKRSKGQDLTDGPLQQPKFYELKDGEIFGNKSKDHRKHVSLGDRLAMGEGADDGVVSKNKSNDGHQMTFNVKQSKNAIKAANEAKLHREERLALRRSASGLRKKKLPPKFYMGKRVK